MAEEKGCGQTGKTSTASAPLAWRATKTDTVRHTPLAISPGPSHGCALMASCALAHAADRATSTNGIEWTDDHQHNPVLGTDPPHSIGDVSSFVYDCTPHDIPASPLCIAS